MQGRYSSLRQYAVTKLKRGALRLVLGRLLRWKPIENPLPGYTILIGCNAPLADMLALNLRLLARQDLTHLDRVLIVFDRPKEQLASPTEERMRSEFPSLPLSFIYYTEKQAATLKRLGWAWIYSWFSWCLAIAQTRTRHAFLHDFDAMLIRRDIVEERYRLIQQKGLEYLSILPYSGNGLAVSDGFATTFEMMFDAAFIRQRFKPLDLFSHVSMYQGKSVDFDTFLWAQSKAGKRGVSTVDMQGLVHPSQMICQYTEFTRQSGYVPPSMNNLLMIPYFLYLSGDREWMLDLQRQMETATDGALTYRGKPMDASKLTAEHVQWLTVQAQRLEAAIHGRTREEVATYFNTLRDFQARLQATPTPTEPLLARAT